MNDTMTKSLLVDDKLMPQMYLTILRGKNYMNKLIQQYVKIEPCSLLIVGYTTS